jgi:hypothetical protein
LKITKLGTVRVVKRAQQLTPEERFKKLGSIARRYGRFPKGTVLPESQEQACPRVKVADLPAGHIPIKFIEGLEQNQLLHSCCRHPENHDIEAKKSHPEEPAPDIYIFHCDKCKRRHVRFMCGFGDDRPVWSVEAA